MAIEHPLRVIGIGDGQAIDIEGCDVLFGGERHLALATTTARKLAWQSPFANNRNRIEHQLEHGHRVAVLASGDPLCFGVGETLIDWFGAKMVQVEAAPSAYALACAAMAWKQQDVGLVTAHGRAIQTLHPALHHGARLIVLGGRDTAVELAAMLQALGLGFSKIKALSHLGGPDQALANHPLGAPTTYPSLTCYAVECRSDGSVEAIARGPGLPDSLFDHDGTMTKRDIRAITLAKLGPRDGQVFWDIGTGNGSIAIEWARLAPNSYVLGVDQSQDRLCRARANAARLAGPTAIQFDAQKLSASLPQQWPTPDAIFVGGGASVPGLLAALWQRLALGGRLVANAVTIQGETALMAWRDAKGGELTRISVAREEAVGPYLGWKPSMPILQYEGHKLK